MTTRFILFIVLQVLDLLTTLFVLNHGGQEGNPLVVWLLKDFSSFALGLMLLKVWAVLCGWIAYSYQSTLFFKLTNVLFSVIVVWNLVAVIGILVLQDGVAGPH